jgi:hypothetical protein
MMLIEFLISLKDKSSKVKVVNWCHWTQAAAEKLKGLHRNETVVNAILDDPLRSLVLQ